MTKKDSTESGSEVKKNNPYKRNKPTKVSDNNTVGQTIEKQLKDNGNNHNETISEEIPLLAGYYFQQLEEQLKQYGSKYEELPNTETREKIKSIQDDLKENEFKFTPILHSRHWCCGVITHNEIYVFDPTLQTQKNKNKEEGMLKIGNVRCKVTYLNHGKQIQNDKGKICGPCVIAFVQEIAKLNSIQEVLDVCRDGDIFKNVAQEVYNEFISELQGKSLQDKVLGETTYEELIKAQFTEKYYDTINKVVVSSREKQEEERLQQQPKEGDETKETKQERGKGFGTIFSKNPNKNRILLFKSLSQLTPAEGTGRIQAPEIEAVEGMDVSIGRHHGMQ